ncbi:putative oxidoreductase [Bifidobacterium scardovii JCM 12489 = DSM 13734]|uniref:Oxidoreductase domain-containing protein n=2 Tax=Bifidobacterium scardovii TaxID=158787 RepID=A0A087D7L0_9BIFI|nr:oxidoreductase domain-containing protein [Bifidobacterium scardovii]BAQ30723.1 putative oxidoreductase [Bifidobacterium scardovii JCM 12489 = DSM 13734]
MNAMAPYSMVVFGDGWRARFFCRMAAAIPDALEVRAVIGHHRDRLESIEREYGVRASTDAALLRRCDPDFVALAVSWPAMPGMIETMAGEGCHVLCETPPAPDLEGLRGLWSRVADRAELVQVGEQYHRMPGHAARLAVIRSGAIGTPNSAEIASTHMYHAVALIRAYLGVGAIRATVNAREFTAPMMNPRQVEGWDDPARLSDLKTTIATIDFGEGRYGLYNFVDNQWWNPLLSRRAAVRGTLGEIVDDRVMRWKDGAPIPSRIEYRRLGVDMNLEGNGIATASFDGNIVYRNAYMESRLSEDDLAVADHLVAMGRYARGEGPAVYPLAEGIHDHAIALAMDESARLGRDVAVEGEAWMA